MLLKVFAVVLCRAAGWESSTATLRSSPRGVARGRSDAGAGDLPKGRGAAPMAGLFALLVRRGPRRPPSTVSCDP
ncbi:hypothetical protein M885DRAFT_515495 [Pelagophyceae sp. CCMP2097]|nr:hypothetical protein M885DRAFT_515495 [Pelagophyceae sp. CCMP2097]